MAPSTSLDQPLGIWDSFICPTPSAFLPTELNPTIHETSATPWAWRLACSHLKATVEGAMNGDDMPQPKSCLEEWWTTCLKFLDRDRILHSILKNPILLRMSYPLLTIKSLVSIQHFYPTQFKSYKSTSSNCWHWCKCSSPTHHPRSNQV